MRACAIILLSLFLSPSAAAQERVLFDWTHDRCARWDIPDAPTRAWRDGSGRIRMIAAAEIARLHQGPSLRDLSHRCTPRFEGSKDPDPAARDDRIWITSIHTRDGVMLEAVGHAEFHGHAHPGTCTAGSYLPCWRNALVALRSRDGGDSFERVPGPPVASLPYPYDPDQTRRSGYFNPSNMIERAGFVYFYFFAEAYRAQKRGVCLMRRPVEEGADSWRFWNGSGFSGRFADPYAAPVAEPEAHVCTPLPGLSATLSSVVYQPATGRYLAVSPMVRKDSSGVRRAGLWTFQSRDLVHWRDANLLAEMPLLWARDCAADHAHAYPAFLDPDSRDRTFATVGEAFWLTYVRMKLNPDCKIGPDRDLVAIDISWPSTPDAQPARR